MPSHPFTTTSSHGLSTPFHWIQFFVFAVATFLQILQDAQTNCLQKWSSKLEKVVGKADKTCFITGTFIKHGNVGELQTDCYIRVCGSTAVTQPSKHSTKNREYMCKSVDIIKLLAKLGLPFRGHRENADAETRGNYLSLCDFFSKYDPDFKSMQSKYFNCTSRDFQNEIIALCAELVREEISKKVHETGFLAVIADEAKSSKTEQLSVCIRYTDGLQIKERFICLLTVPILVMLQGLFLVLKKDCSRVV